MAMAWEGPNAVAAIRQTMGATRPTEAAPGSIRHDFALEVGRNLTHASDSVENGEQEVSLWFGSAELVNWKRDADLWIFEANNQLVIANINYFISKITFQRSYP